MKKKLLVIPLLVLLSFGIFGIVVAINKFAPKSTVLGTSSTNSAVINVRDLGAVGDGKTDDTKAIQNALNSSAGRTVFVPKGIYVITSPLTFATNSNTYTNGPTIIGEGRYNTVFDNRVSNGALLSIRSESLMNFQMGGKLEAFSIITTTNPANSSGIEMKGVWQYEINNIRIQGLSGDGIRISSKNNDSDSSAYIQIKNAFIIRNGGYGFVSALAPSQNAISFLTISNSFIMSNVSGGIRHGGLTSYITDNSIAYNTGTGGIYVPYNGVHAQNMTVVRNEFDGNIPSQVNIEAIMGLEVSMNQVTVNPLKSYGGMIKNLPAEGFRFGYGGTTNNLSTVKNVHVSLNRFRVDASANPFSGYIMGPNTYQVKIENTVWHVFGATGQTKFLDYGHNTKIDD